ncbi:MAG: discoidin domain-containing protein [Sandaracinaceae bacterium]
MTTTRGTNVGRRAAALVVALALVGCGGSSSDEPPAPPPPSPPPAAPAPAPAPVVTGTVPYTVAAGVPVWNASYEVSNLADGNPATAWYTPVNHPMPVTMTLQLGAPATLVAVDFDTTLGSYATSAARIVRLEALAPAGQVVSTVDAGLHASAITTVPFPGPVVASAVRLTISQNHGGSYVGLADVALRTTPGAGQPPVALTDRGLQYAPSELPEWNSSYAASRLADGDSATHWFTPVNQTFPVQGLLTFPTPATITGVVFDNRLGSYASSGARRSRSSCSAPPGTCSTCSKPSWPKPPRRPSSCPSPSSRRSSA